MKFVLFKAIEEQQIVCFSGKINILKRENKESVGCLYLIDGLIVNATCGELYPLRAVFKLVVDYQNNDYQIIVEPELLSNSIKKIDYPHNVLVRKLEENFKQLSNPSGQKPPEHLKLLIKSEFVKSGGEVTPMEYKLLSTISDYNLVKDIYEHSELFEFEITELLVNLRQKDALKVVEVKEG